MDLFVCAFGMLNWAVLISYLLIIAGMGFYFSFREKTSGDYFLAGKRIPWWAAGLSIVATGLSAMTFMAIPAKAYASDWKYYIGAICPILLIPIVTRFYLPFYHKLEISTAYEYLEKRFSVSVRLAGGAFYVSFQFFRMAIVMFLPAAALSTATGMSTYTCIYIMGILCIIYTTLGGIEAVIWTDVLQVVLLLGAAVAAVVIICLKMPGGMGEIISLASANDKFRLVQTGWNWELPVLWVVLAGNFFANLAPNTADQGVVQRYLAVKDLSAARKAAWINGLSAFPIVAMFLFLGTAIWAFYHVNPQLVSDDLPNDRIFAHFLVQQMPAGLAGLVIAGLFAAAMSSIDSGMNAISAVSVIDVYKRFSKSPSEAKAMKIARAVTLLSGVIATLCALVIARNEGQIKSMWTTFLSILGMVYGPLGGIFFLGIFTRKANTPGVLAGACLGFACALLASKYTAINGLLYSVISVGVCVITGYTLSRILPDSKKR